MHGCLGFSMNDSIHWIESYQDVINHYSFRLLLLLTSYWALAFVLHFNARSALQTAFPYHSTVAIQRLILLQCASPCELNHSWYGSRHELNSTRSWFRIGLRPSFEFRSRRLEHCPIVPRLQLSDSGVRIHNHWLHRRKIWYNLLAPNCGANLQHNSHWGPPWLRYHLTNHDRQGTQMESLRHLLIQVHVWHCLHIYCSWWIDFKTTLPLWRLGMPSKYTRKGIRDLT